MIGVSVVGLIAVVAAILWTFACIASSVWAMADANKRGKPGCLVGLLVLFLFWPFSLLVWIALRPEKR